MGGRVLWPAAGARHSVVPADGKYPLLVTAKYLQQRADWIVRPCNKCGLSELFDAPSDLIRKIFRTFPPMANWVHSRHFVGTVVTFKSQSSKDSTRKTYPPRSSRRLQKGRGGLSGSVLCGVIVVVSLATKSTAFAQQRSPHRYIPRKGLVAYLEYDGLQQHSEAWKKTSASKLLTDTPAGSIVSEVARQALDELLKMNAGAKLTGADLLALHDHLLLHGVVIAVHDWGKEGYSNTIILERAGDQAIRERLDRLAEVAIGGADKNEKRPAAITLRGRDM
jgi:hypothetical protein